MKCWCGGDIVSSNVCADSQFHDPLATGRPAKIETLYVAGPMSNYPQCNYPLFNEVSDTLRESGFTVVNPAEYGEGRHYVDFLREDLRMMLNCDGVATLDGWWESVGARNEVQVAGVLMMPVLPWETWALNR